MDGLLSDKKSFVIVCDEKTHEYADFLLQLMKDKDNKIENVSGAIWTERHYTDNEPKITNKLYKLFLGNCKLAQRKRKHIKISYSKYGINYGWLGTDAFLFVEDAPLETDEYTSFIEESKKYGNLLDHNNNISLIEALQDDESSDVKKEEDKTEDTKGFFSSLIEKGKKIDIDTVSNQVTSLTKDFKNTPSKIYNAAKIRFYKDEIINQQYSFAMVQFYSEGLKQFLEL